MTKRLFASYTGLISASTFLLLYAGSRVGTGADSEIDTQMILWNLGELGIGPKVTQFSGLFSEIAVTDELVSIMASYGFTLFTLLELPIMGIERIIGHDLGLPNYYMARNFLAVIVLILCAHSVGRIIQILRGNSFRNYAFGFCLTLILPGFSGNGLFNVKDVPFATAFSFGILSSILVLKHLNHLQISHRFLNYEIFIYSMLTILLSAGVRPASVFMCLLPLLVQWVGILYFWIKRTLDNRSFLLLAIQLSGFLVGFVIVIITNSQAMPNPLSWLENAITISSKFPWTGAVKADGIIYYSPDIPAEYWLKVVFFKTPLLFVTLSLIGLISLVKSKNDSLLIKFIVFTPLIALIPILVRESVIYDNARHLLFLQIFILILSSIALVSIFDGLILLKPRSMIAVGALAVLLAKLLFDSVSLFPYNYVYVNEIAQNYEIGSRWEFDYYGISAKETQEFVNRNYKSINEASIFYQSFVPYMESNISNVPSSSPNLDIYAQVWRPTLIPDYFESCPKVFQVTRKLSGQEILLSYARQCSDVAQVNPN